MDNPATSSMVESAALSLLAAEGSRTPRRLLTEQWPVLDPAIAYRIQDRLLQEKISRGDRVVGVKLALTSLVKQQQMGITVPVTAWLTESMKTLADTEIPWNRLINPRVEPEIVFVLDKRIEGPGVTADSALAAVGSVFAGVEVVDSRYTARPALTDLIADNASAAYFVLGDIECSPKQLDLATEQCVLSVDGRTVASGTGADVLGHPADALALAANLLAERGLALEAGRTVLTGGITDAVTVSAQIVANFTHLGPVAIQLT